MLSRAAASQRGITLIESAVTLTVMALMLSAVAPEVGRWLANTRVRNAAESLRNGLLQARVEAVRRNEDVTFWLVTAAAPSKLDDTCALSSTSVSWVVSLNSPVGKCAASPSTRTDPLLIEKLAAGTSVAGITIAATDASGTGASSVTFDSFGRVVGGSAIAAVSVGNAVSGNDFRALRVGVSSGGNVRICDPRVTDAADPRKC